MSHEVTVLLTMEDLCRIDSAFHVSEGESYVGDDDRVTWLKIINACHRLLGEPPETELPNMYGSERERAERARAEAERIEAEAQRIAAMSATERFEYEAHRRTHSITTSAVVVHQSPALP